MIEEGIKDHRSEIMSFRITVRARGLVEMVGGDRSTVSFLSLQKHRERERERELSEWFKLMKDTKLYTQLDFVNSSYTKACSIC